MNRIEISVLRRPTFSRAIEKIPVAAFALAACLFAPATAEHSLQPNSPTPALSWKIGAVAFSRGRSTTLGDTRIEIFIDNRYSKKPRLLTEGFDPDWSPHGSRIAFAGTGDRRPKTDIFVINADGSGRRQITRVPGNNYAGTPSWSPDGQKLAFSVMSRRNAPSQIWLVNSDGTDLKFLKDGFRPRWSPDGHKLIFVRASKENRSSVWEANVDGSAVRQIIDDTAMSRYPRWSPDGRKIVFSSDREGHSAIYTADPDGNNVQRLIYSNSLDFFCPLLSPDEKHLVVYAGRIFAERGRTMMRVDGPISILMITLNSTHETDFLDQGTAPSVLWVKK